MTLDAYAQGLLGVFCIAVTVVALWRWIPWVGKLLALYGMHGLRDRVYSAALLFPEASNSRLYRDAETHFCIFIKVVRDAPYEMTLGAAVHSSALTARAPSQRALELRRIYSTERQHVFVGEQGQRAHDMIVDALVRSRGFLTLYAVLGHPAMQLLGVIYLAWKVVTLPSRWLATYRLPVEIFSAQVDATRKMKDAPPAGRSLMSILAERNKRAA